MNDADVLLDHTELLISIEEIKKELYSYCNVLRDGANTLQILDNVEKINKISLENNDSDLLKFNINILNVSLENIGYKRIETNDNVSIEGIGSDIWLAIKKVFEKIANVFSGFYKKIREFFKVTEIRVNDLKKKIDAAPDLEDFKLNKDDNAKIVKSVTDSLKLFSSLGLDILSTNDVNKFTDAVIASNWLYENSEILYKGNSSASNEIQYPGAFSILKGKTGKIFSNIAGAVEDSKDVNSRYIVLMAGSACSMMTLKKSGDFINADFLGLTIDPAKLESNRKSEFSELNKKKMYAILEDLNKLKDKEAAYTKSNESFLKTLSIKTEEMTDKQNADKVALTNNVNRISTFSGQILTALTNTVVGYNVLAERLFNVYEKTAKKNS